MIDVTEATAADRDDWNRFVAESRDAEPYHPYAWRELFERVFGHRCIYLLARDESAVVQGILPLVQLKSRLFGNFLVSVPCFTYCGTLSDTEAVRRDLVNAAWERGIELGASHIELRHCRHVDLNLPFRSDKVSMQLTLPASSDELWQDFPSKLRAQIRRPTKEGATCIEGGAELLDEFYEVFSRNMRDLGTPVFPKALFHTMCDLFPADTRVFVVRLGGRPCAAGITYGFRERLEIQSASSLREFNRVSVNMLLYWSVLQYAIRQGYKVFDFGRSTAGSGTFRFKRQWGAESEPLHWHYCLLEHSEIPQLNPQNPKFDLAIRIWRHLPVKVANMLGPRIVRYLP